MKKIRRERLCGKCVLISWFRVEVIVVNEGGKDLLLILKSRNIEGFVAEQAICFTGVNILLPCLWRIQINIFFNS